MRQFTHDQVLSWVLAYMQCLMGARAALGVYLLLAGPTRPGTLHPGSAHHGSGWGS